MTRRVFLRDLARIGGSMAGLGLLAGCAPPPAAPLGRVYRVGMLAGSAPGSQPGEEPRPSFWQRLGELGYVEGQNLAREIRQTEGEDNAQYDAFAADLVRLQVDVIVAALGPGIRAAVAATSSIPIVMLGAGLDPVAEGFADSIARPGRNLTGTMGAPLEVYQKRMQLLVEAAPGVTKVAVLAAGAPMPDDFWESAARSLGVDLMTLRVTSRDELDAAFERVMAEGADSLLVQEGVATNLNGDLILSFAERHRLPAVYPGRLWVTRGGLMVYQAVGPEIQRRTADFVDRILRGARPADLPIENPTRYELVVNMTTARQLGLTFPASFRVQVDEVME